MSLKAPTDFSRIYMGSTKGCSHSTWWILFFTKPYTKTDDLYLGGSSMWNQCVQSKKSRRYLFCYGIQKSIKVHAAWLVGPQVLWTVSWSHPGQKVIWQPFLGVKTISLVLLCTTSAFYHRTFRQWNYSKVFKKRKCSRIEHPAGSVMQYVCKLQ